MNTQREGQSSFEAENWGDYSDLFNYAHDFVFTLTSEGQIVSCNPAFERKTGWSIQEWTGNRFDGLIHAADVPKLHEAFRQANDDENPSLIELRLRSKFHNDLVLECTTFPIRRSRGEARIMIFGKDITERKRTEEELFESDAKLRSVLESANAIVFIGSDLEILSWNRAAQEIFGHSEQISGKPFKTLLAEPYRGVYLATVEQLREGGESRLLGKTLELHGVRADHTEFPLELSLAVWVFRGNPIFAAIIRDITNRKKAEEALRKKTKLVQLIQEIAIASNEALHPEEAMQYALDRICAYTSWPIGHVYLPANGNALSTAIWHIQDEKRLEQFKTLTKTGTVLGEKSLPGQVISSKKSIWIRDVTAESNFTRGSEAIQCGLKTAFAMPVLKGSEVLAVLEFFSDSSEETDQEMINGMELVGTQLGRVFEREEALKRLREAQERLRALSAHLQFVREQERIKIAREVHDDLGQVLSALRMELSLLNQSLLDSSAQSPRQQILQELGTMSNLVDDTIRSVRRIITELRPEVLDHLDLSSALEWQIGEFRARTGIKTSFHSTIHNSPLNQESVTALFRILQETLTNVSRHAQATWVQVKLIDNEDSIILEVKDNGRGITEEETRKAGSFGIMGMKERVLLLGGKLDMQGTPGKGTTVSVEIPLAENR
jgi:PAS domain S-box-containing protein